MKKCGMCDIKKDSPCQMCRYSNWQGCEKGNRKGGLHRKCFACKDEAFCKEQSSAVNN